MLNILFYVSVNEVNTERTFPIVFLFGSAICQNDGLVWVTYCFSWEDGLRYKENFRLWYTTLHYLDFFGELNRKENMRPKENICSLKKIPLLNWNVNIPILGKDFLGNITPSEGYLFLLFHSKWSLTIQFPQSNDRECFRSWDFFYYLPLWLIITLQTANIGDICVHTFIVKRFLGL